MNRDMTILTEVLHYWGKHLGRNFKRGLAEGVSPPMDYAMRLIREPRSMSELARLMDMPKQQMTVIADKLINLSLAQRMTNEKDRRVVMLVLTEKGRDCLEEARKRMETGFCEMYAAMTEADRVRFDGALKTLHEVFLHMEMNETEQKED